MIRLEVKRLVARVSRGLRVGSLAALALLAAGFAGTRAASSEPTSASLTPAGLPSTKAVEARLAEARADLVALESAGDSALTNAPPGVSAEDVWIRRALRHRLVRMYEQQLANAAEIEATRVRRAELVRTAQNWTRFSDPPPYSVLLVDRLREELQAARLKASTSDKAVAMLDQLIEENRGSLAQAEEGLRQLDEQLENATDPALVARLSWQRDLQRLRNQTAAANVAVLDSERDLRQEELGEARTRADLLQRQLVVAEAGATFTRADLDEINARIEKEGEQLKAELEQAQAKRAVAAQELESAREALRAAGPDAKPRAAELVALREAQVETADTANRVLRGMLEGMNLERTMWELRYAAHGSRSVDTLRGSAHRLEAFRRRLSVGRERERQVLDVSSSEIQIQETRLSSLPQDSELRPLALERLATLRERDQLVLRLVRAIERGERLTQRWAEELREAEVNLPLTGRMQNLVSDARLFLKRLWTFELFAAEDTITVDGQRITGRRSVTIGKVVGALLILVVGYWLTGLLSMLLEPVFVRRLKIEPNQANLIRRWFRALLVVGLVVFSLISVKIPLTVFAFAGGALAIGLGFGMQTVLKNFVSGVIILFERPFRVGDVLDVSGYKGTVTGIGLRASVLQLWDGTETLIPNSALLEGNLTNWTYSNRVVRFTVSVGVAYGSDPRRVVHVLNEVAGRHGLIEKEPKPQVLFTDFADSNLTFELRFWVDVTRVNAAQVSSDLRLMIAAAFAEHSLVVAFPQRDIYLHPTQPIPVEVQTAVGTPASPANPPAAGPNPAPPDSPRTP